MQAPHQGITDREIDGTWAIRNAGLVPYLERPASSPHVDLTRATFGFVAGDGSFHAIVVHLGPKDRAEPSALGKFYVAINGSGGGDQPMKIATEQQDGNMAWATLTATPQLKVISELIDRSQQAGAKPRPTDPSQPANPDYSGRRRARGNQPGDESRWQPISRGRK